MQNQTVLNIINKYFEKQKASDFQIFNMLSLYIYKVKSQQHNSDLHILAKILQPEQLRSLIDYYNGDVIKIPSKEEFMESIFLSICFYLKEIKGYSWQEIKEFISLPEAYKDLLSSISIGKQINTLKENMGKDIMELIKTMDIHSLQDILNGVKL